MAERPPSAVMIERVRKLALRRADALVADRDRDAAADRGRRVRHRADDRAAADLLQRFHGGPGHDRDHQR